MLVSYKYDLLQVLMLMPDGFEKGYNAFSNQRYPDAHADPACRIPGRMFIPPFP